MAANGAVNGQVRQWSTESTIPLWLHGKEVTASKTFDVTSPVTNSVLYKSSAASETDAEAAIASCAKAFPAWSKTKPQVRREIFLRAADGFAARKEEAWKYLREETGAERPLFEFIHNASVEYCKDMAGLLTAIRGTVPTLSKEGSSAIVIKEPYGVVVGIAPWNAPSILGIRACLTPLAAGNTVILKGSEFSPASFWLIASVLHEAGLPAGCLNTVLHRPGEDAVKVTNTLIASPTVRKINFTGSTHVGGIIASLAGKHLKPVLMELGGKAPSIVCEDADLQKAARGCAIGSLLHSGQICMSTERILVHKSIAPKFKEAFTGAVEQIFGAGKDAPILVDGAPVVKNKKLVEDAARKGAKPIYGDLDASEASKTRMRPVVMEGVEPGMDLYYTESFGPTVSLIQVESDEEAIRIANDTEYGLTSAVFTEDLRRGLKIAKQIETGAVHINSMSVHDESALPHGGAKKSGFGRFNSLEGLEEWVRTKTVTWQD